MWSTRRPVPGSRIIILAGSLSVLRCNPSLGCAVAKRDVADDRMVIRGIQHAWMIDLEPKLRADFGADRKILPIRCRERRLTRVNFSMSLTAAHA